MADAKRHERNAHAFFSFVIGCDSMHKVSLYGEHSLSNRIAVMNFWRQHTDFILLPPVTELRVLKKQINEERPQVVLFSSEHLAGEQLSTLEELKQEFPAVKVIVVGKEQDYHLVRELFLLGMSDYLTIYDLNIFLEVSLLHICENEENYIEHQLKQSLCALVNALFEGNYQPKDSDTILLRIGKDFENTKMAEQVADKAKKRLYQMVVEQKAWLSKFICEKGTASAEGSQVRSLEQLREEWKMECSSISRLISKYEFINDKRIARIGNYVVEHVDEKLSLDKVAFGVYLNASYISAIFKKTTGINFTDFVAEVKVDRAKLLLRDSTSKVYDVASAVGYHNVEYFTKIFKRKTGMAPLEYRKHLQK